MKLPEDGKIIWSDINKRISQNRVVNFYAVEQSITTIIVWKRLTRKFLRDFGSNIETLLFLPCEEESAALIELEISKRINKWDDRPQVKIKAIPFPDEGLYKVECFYVIEGLGQGRFDFFLGKN